MKKIILTITLLFTAALLWAGTPSKVQSLINEYKHHEGFEGITLGPISLAIVRGIALHSDDIDDEDRAFLKSFSSVSRVSILDFEDAEPGIKSRFVEKVKKVLDKMSLILEAKDSGETVRIYAEEDGDDLRDCVLFSDEGTIILVRGKVKTEQLMAAFND